MIILAPSLYRKWTAGNHQIDQDNREEINQWYQEILGQIREPEQQKRPEEQRSALDLQPFDPNTVSTADLLKMGIRTQIVANIEKYRLKGGKFRQKSDFAKIYGLDDELFEQIKPFIRLPVTSTPIVSDEPKQLPDQSQLILRDINRTSADQLMEIKGIGKVLSERIIKYRDYLGGYYSLEQLNEVYGLGDDVIEQLKLRYSVPDSTALQKITLNSASEEDLRGHPYIDYNLAKVIASYIEQHYIRSVEDIRQIKIMNDSIYRKLAPYLTVSDAIKKEADQPPSN